MPTTRADINKMKKAALVDFACDFFEDTGNLRQEMEVLNKDDLRDLLLDHGAGAEIEYSTPAPEVEAKSNKGPLDLG